VIVHNYPVYSIKQLKKNLEGSREAVIEDGHQDPSVLFLLPGHPVINTIYPHSCRYYWSHSRYRRLWPAGVQAIVHARATAPGRRRRRADSGCTGLEVPTAISPFDLKSFIPDGLQLYFGKTCICWLENTVLIFFCYFRLWVRVWDFFEWSRLPRLLHQVRPRPAFRG
jgi:hypothetical protein